jgi:hypothetical protein
MARENGFVIVQTVHSRVHVYGPDSGGLYADMDAAQADADKLANPNEERLEIQGVLPASGDREQDE